MDRRRFLSLAPAAAAASATSALPALAAAPLAGSAPPGFYRMKFGDHELTVLLDGTVPVPLTALYNNTSPERVEEGLAAAFLRSPVDLSVNAFLVNTGERLVLIDTGTGTLLGPTLGRLPSALKASGYSPDQVDDVVLTHIHTDHSGGLVVDGEQVFPNATVHAHRRDVDYWLSEANRAAAPADKKELFEGAVASLEPYRKAGRLVPFDDNAEPVPGFRTVFRPGHTPGHSAVVVESRGEKLVLWGDITHGDVIQFDEPGVGIAFDEDTPAAVATRALAFAEAADERYLVGGAHIRFPGLGHVRRDDKGYDWVPLNYTLPG